MQARAPPRGRPRSCRTACRRVMRSAPPQAGRRRRRAGRPPPCRGSRSGGAGRRRTSRSRPRRAGGARRRCRGRRRRVVDEADLARAGLVHRRVAGAAGRGAGREDVARELGALAGQRRREDLVAVAGASPPRRRSRARTIETAPPSSRRSSCRGADRGPAAIRAATCSVGLVSPRSTWLSIGAETPERSARSRRHRSMRLAQRAHAGADGDVGHGRGGHRVAYVIAYSVSSPPVGAWRSSRTREHARMILRPVRGARVAPAPSSSAWRLPGVAAAARPATELGSRRASATASAPRWAIRGHDVRRYDVAWRDPTAGAAAPAPATSDLDAKATQSLSSFDLDWAGTSTAPSRRTAARRPSCRTARNRIAPRSRSTRARGVPRRGGRATRRRQRRRSRERRRSTAFFCTPRRRGAAGAAERRARLPAAHDHPRDKATFTFRLDVPAGVRRSPRRPRCPGRRPCGRMTV